MGGILKTAGKWTVGYFLAEKAVGIISNEVANKVGKGMVYLGVGAAIYYGIKAVK